jgi:integrase
VPLNGPAMELLRSIRSESKGDVVFEGAGGDPLTDIKRTWVSACKSAGLTKKVQKRDRSGKLMFDKEKAPILIDEPTVRIHDLRHSFASILVSAGASLPLIGQLVEGPSRRTTLNAYSLNNLTAKSNADGSFTIQFGGCQRTRRTTFRS